VRTIFILTSILAAALTAGAWAAGTKPQSQIGAETASGTDLGAGASSTLGESADKNQPDGDAGTAALEGQPMSEEDRDQARKRKVTQ
jgi:hypothetical protein